MAKTTNGRIHYLIIFLEPSEDPYFTPLKIGKRFFNRVAIDENAGFEIMSVFLFEAIVMENGISRSQ